MCHRIVMFERGCMRHFFRRWIACVPQQCVLQNTDVHTYIFLFFPSIMLFEEGWIDSNTYKYTNMYIDSPLIFCSRCRYIHLISFRFPSLHIMYHGLLYGSFYSTLLRSQFHNMNLQFSDTQIVYYKHAACVRDFHWDHHPHLHPH